MYNEAAKGTICNVANSSEEDHTRRQVQMHSAARHLADHFRKQAPKEFGKTFWYNCVYFFFFYTQVKSFTKTNYLRHYLQQTLLHY